MREYIKAVQALFEAENDKTKTKDQTGFKMDMDDGASKGDLTNPSKPSSQRTEEPRRNRADLPGVKARGPAQINPGRNTERSATYLRDLFNQNLQDEISDEEAARNVDGDIDPLMIGGQKPLSLTGETEPVTPENLPATINKALFKKEDGAAPTVRPPEWHMVKNLPGYMQQGIRAMGRMVFAPFTDTPIEKIQVMASLINERDVRVMADFIRKNAFMDDEATMEAHDIIPGYGAQIQIWNMSGCTFMLVRDHAGEYIYGWPGGRGTDLDAPENHLRLENVDLDELSEGDLSGMNSAQLAQKVPDNKEIDPETDQDVPQNKSGSTNGTKGTVQDQQQQGQLQESVQDDGTADYFAKLAGVRPTAKTPQIVDQDVLDLAKLAGVRK